MDAIITAVKARFFISFFASAWLPVSVASACLAPPDVRTWDQVVADFTTTQPINRWDGSKDGARLKKLDAERAVAIFLPFLSEQHPLEMRLKAIHALGRPDFPAALDPLIRLAEDQSQPAELRTAALNPGLRYQKNPLAERVGISLASDPDPKIRRAARGVVSQHGTDEGVELLVALLETAAENEKASLLFGLKNTKNPLAGTRVYATYRLGPTAQTDQLRAYTSVLLTYEVKAAKADMLSLIDHADSIVAINALNYFKDQPAEEVASHLIGFVKARPVFGSSLREMALNYVVSKELGSASRLVLSQMLKTNAFPRMSTDDL